MSKKQYFTVRLNKVKIFDNREWFTGAEVKILSFLTTGNNMLPSLEEYQTSLNDDTKKTVIREAAKELVSLRNFIEVQNVKDDSELTFGSAGISVVTLDQIPVDFNWSLVLFENDSDVRELGNTIVNLTEDEEFDGFLSDLITFVATSTSPQLIIASRLGKYVAKKAGQLLAENKDDQIGLFYEGLNRFEHYPHGTRDKRDVRGVNGNIYVDYQVFGTEY